MIKLRAVLRNTSRLGVGSRIKRMMGVTWGGWSVRITGNTDARMPGGQPGQRPRLVFTGVTREGVGLLLLLLGRVTWAGRIRLVIRRGQETVVDIRRLGKFANDWRLGSGSIRESGGAGRWNVRGLNCEGERLDIFVFYETPNVATSVFSVQNVF